MSQATPSAAWSGLRAQWQGNLRLRAGGWLVIGILWVYALLLAADAVLALRKGSDALVAEIDRLQPLTRANPWPARVDDARQQLAALQSMEWTEGEGGDLGLTEAALQDWVRATAAKAGLRVREMSLSRPEATTLGAATGSNDSSKIVKLRLSTDWGRSELVVFLAEVGRSERVVVVERLLLRPGAAPPGAEIDLRVVARMAAAADTPREAVGATR
jgi:Type II secretion system (T2SS), protein M subtype b